MALPPSSPPLLPSDFIDTTPPSPSPSEEADAEELPLRPAIDAAIGPSRKRQLSGYDSLSSDPLFSEDVSDADGPYDAAGERPRRKRVLRGPWYNLRRTSEHSLRRGLGKREKMRNADSGIWLGSDLSDESIDSVMSSQHRLENLEVREKSSVEARLRAPSLSRPETMAEQVITQCLETGKEKVDISGLGLTSLPNSLIRPLHQLIKHSHINLTEPPSEDEFTTLTPSIQLFMSGNRISSLPTELFRLTNITVLSLRNNFIDEIPSSIARLANLQELNVAQNEIRTLPWEMFDLIHSDRRVQVRPNPLVSPIQFEGRSPLPLPNMAPGEYGEHMSRWGETSGAFFHKMKQWYSEDDVQWTMRHELELRLKLGRARQMNYLQEVSRSGREVRRLPEEMIFLAASAIRYFDIDGSRMRLSGVRKAQADEEDHAAVFDPVVDIPATMTPSKVPSLFETCLRAAQAQFNLHDLPEDVPPGLKAGLVAAAKGTDLANEACAVCGHSYVVPRAEWVEFWFNGYPSQVDGLTQETVLPFLRKACSWQCATPNEIGAFRF